MYIVELDSASFEGRVCFLVKLGNGVTARMLGRKVASRFATRLEARKALSAAKAEIAYTPPEMLSPRLEQRLNEARIIKA